MQKFNLVDFAAHYQKGFRNHVVPITDVPSLVESFQHYGCYATYFLYSDEILTYMSATSGEATPTVSGYQGKVWAPFFPIDLDHQNTALALEAARHLTDMLISRWKVDAHGLQIYFSGSKGFHLMLSGHLFGKMLPSRNLPLVFDSMRRHMALELPENLRETVDLSIKDRVRLLRLPNTIHEKSKLYKVVLSLDELHRLNPEAIRNCARSARPLTLTDKTGLISYGNIAPNAAASDFLQHISRQLKKFTRKPFSYKFTRPGDIAHVEFPCAALEVIWKSHIDPGNRNNCAIRLASELRLLGLSEEETANKLMRWNETNNIGLPPDELHNVVRSAYLHHFPYRYSCRDEVLRHYCPLPDYESCRKHVSEHLK